MFVMMSPKFCFVCLKRVTDNSKNEDNNQKQLKTNSSSSSLYPKFFSFIYKYFKFGAPASLSPNNDNPIFSNLSKTKETSENDSEEHHLISLFCESCEGVISTICCLYSELLAAQLRLSWKLGELGELLEGAKNEVSDKLWNVLARSLAAQLTIDADKKVEISHVNELRNELMVKCAQQRELSPKILVNPVANPESFQKRDRVGHESGRPIRSSELSLTPDDFVGKTNCINYSRINVQSPTPSCSESVVDDDNRIKIEVESGLEEEEDDPMGNAWFPEGEFESRNPDLKPGSSSWGHGTRRSQRLQPHQSGYGSRLENLNESDDNDPEFKVESASEDSDNNTSKEDSPSESEWSEAEASQNRKSKSVGKKKARTTGTKTLNKAGQRASIRRAPKKVKVPDDVINEQCDHCGKILTVEKDFKIHLKNSERTCPKKTKQCCFCWRSFGYHQSLKMHMKMWHENVQQPFFCCESQCGEMFYNGAELGEHLQSHSNSYSANQCLTCGLSFITPDFLKLHEILHTKPNEWGHNCRGRIRCPSCSSEFGTAVELQDHYSKEHGLGLKFECPKCDEIFSTNLSLAFHFKNSHVPLALSNESSNVTSKEFMLQHNPIKVKREPPPKKCKRVGSSKKPKPKPRCIHKKKLTKQLKPEKDSSQICPVCGKQLSKTGRGALESHLLTHMSLEERQQQGKLYICEMCGKNYGKPEYLKTHVKYVHEKTIPTTIQNLKCMYPSCTRLFRTKSKHMDRQNHVEQDHVPQTEFEFFCRICGRVFVNEERLQKHSKFHLGEKEYKCHLCPNSYGYKISLSTHLKSGHGIGREGDFFNCSAPNCDNKYASLYVLQKHMRDEHNIKSKKRRKRDPTNKNWVYRAKPLLMGVKCMYPSCPRFFKTGNQRKKDRQEHVEKEHCQNAEYSFMCRVCGRVFINQERLEAHNKTHIELEERPWKCGQCSRSYFNKCSLDTHVKEVHEMEQKDSYPCTESNCTRVLGSLYALRKHLRLAHNAGKRRNRGKLYSDSERKRKPANTGRPPIVKKDLEMLVKATSSQAPIFPDTK
ncbi:unnamed protein product [Orchesella dallaii]|uniref:C2H2-type domain-containing protein n=1 Tax=Orchesella dallaii TaxID=48710 RepID=A0ABP1RIZ1_9HEXA